MKLLTAGLTQDIGGGIQEIVMFEGGHAKQSKLINSERKNKISPVLTYSVEALGRSLGKEAHSLAWLNLP